MDRFKDKKVIVTGGCRGIGKVIVEGFLKEGAIVATTYNSSAATAEEMKKDFPDKLFTYQMDVSDPEQVESTMEKIQKDIDGVDVLVNNAGITKDGLLYMMSNKDWDDVIKTNLYGTFYTCRSVLYNMIRQKGGSIVNVSSVSGVKGIAGQSNYCASKFGVVGLTESLAKEVAKKKIRVNAVAPGFIDTEMVTDLKDINKKNALGRVGKKEEVANIVLFLASEEASYITGQVIVADGALL